MKIHVLANPRNPTGLINRIDPFAVHAYKYIKHLSSRYEVVHYGVPGAQVDCEHIDVSPIDNENVTAFNQDAGNEISKRKSPGDIIACFFGVENKIACDMNKDCIPIEPSIGYRSNGVFAPYRVFTSYANMTYFYGSKDMLMQPSWYDAVIGNPFTVSEFDYCDQKENYFVFLGRVIKEKGVELAIQATEKLGVKLKIAGNATSLHHLGYSTIPDHVELIGLVNAEQRNEVLKKAKGLLGLTYYLEPFGNMIIEANLCGTPVITTDWGAFPEIVHEGKTGYRVRDFQSLLTAIKSIEDIDPMECRNWGMNFSDEEIHDKHHLYLQKLIKNNFYA